MNKRLETYFTLNNNNSIDCNTKVIIFELIKN